MTGKPEKEKEKSGKEKHQSKVEFNPWRILRFPHLTEKSMNMIDTQNKLVFIVDRRIGKNEIKEAVERGFSVKVAKVNVEITRKGQKKAYVKLAPEFDATDIASKLGMM